MRENLVNYFNSLTLMALKTNDIVAVKTEVDNFSFKKPLVAKLTYVSKTLRLTDCIMETAYSESEVSMQTIRYMRISISLQN